MRLQLVSLDLAVQYPRSHIPVLAGHGYLFAKCEASVCWIAHLVAHRPSREAGGGNSDGENDGDV